MGQPAVACTRDEQWVVTGDVRFGHMWMRFNTFFPFASNPDPEQQVFAFERMDLQLKDGNFWVGFAGLEVQPVPTFVLFARYGINVPRLSHMYMDATGRFTRPGTAIIDTTVPACDWRRRETAQIPFRLGLGTQRSTGGCGILAGLGGSPRSWLLRPVSGWSTSITGCKIR